MIEKIEPIPKIPKALRLAAIQRTKIVPFIGAGLSKVGGCHGWNEFADAALKFFVDKGKLSHAQLDQISTLPTRVKLSVALEFERKYELPIAFKELLLPSDSRRAIGDKVYADISNLATMFVTTNYDEWLDSPTPATLDPSGEAAPSLSVVPDRKPFYKRADITAENLDIPNAVFHIHGSVLDRESMVLTTVDYLERYSSHRIDGGKNHENPFLTFLEVLFKSKNVLFIGYGLHELEVLEYVVQKGIEKPAISDEEPQHYVLQGFFSHEIELARSLEGYFRQFGIGLIPFSRDERDWDQLVDVVRYFSRELLPSGPPLALAKRREMEDLLP